MPVYEYQCGCGKRFDKFLRLADYQSEVTCECGAVATKVLSAPAVIGDYPGYECPVSGKWVEGRKAHEENLKRTGCRVYEPGEREAFVASRAREEASFDATIEASVEAELASMPTRKLEQLASELSSGADIKVERTAA